LESWGPTNINVIKDTGCLKLLNLLDVIAFPIILSSILQAD
jgi:hypothetical protein